MVPSPQALWRSWVFIGSLIAVCAVLAWRSGGPARVGEAGLSAAQLFLGVLPNLLLGFTLAGFLHVLLPADQISQWMGQSSGWRGLCVGTIGGMLTPGGPFTHFPILASFLAKGAGIGPVSAYIAAWALLGLNRIIVWELPILGPRIALARFAASLVVPPLVGWLSACLYARIAWRA